jgi:hypothetical protein
MSGQNGMIRRLTQRDDCPKKCCALGIFGFAAADGFFWDYGG